MIQAIAFYIFALVVLVSGAMTIASRNPVHSVLWLILAFFNAAGLMVLVGAEFIAMLLVIVYVGAVAVLFLFVVMMLDIDFAQLRAGFVRYFGIGLVLAVALVAVIAQAFGSLRLVAVALAAVALLNVALVSAALAALALRLFLLHPLVVRAVLLLILRVVLAKQVEMLRATRLDVFL